MSLLTWFKNLFIPPEERATMAEEATSQPLATPAVDPSVASVIAPVDPTPVQTPTPAVEVPAPPVAPAAAAPAPAAQPDPSSLLNKVEVDYDLVRAFLEKLGHDFKGKWEQAVALATKAD